MSYTIDTPLNQPVDIKPIQLDQFLVSKKGKDNPLIGLGDTIVTIGWMYKINPIYILAHAIWESGWGSSDIAKKKFNLFGWNAVDSDPVAKATKFRNYDHCILKVMSRIRAFYFDQQGRITLNKMGEIYASDPDWKNGIVKIMNSIEQFIQEGGN